MTTLTQTVYFNNNDIKLAAVLRLPPGFSKDKTYPALVCAHPISSCKEQTAGVIYGEQLRAAGFITLAFDAGFQGDSDGSPRYLEDPARRIEDFRCAADYLVTLPFVAAERIGVLGICGGGGYTAAAAMTERRFKAVATVAAVNYGALTREGDNTAGAALRLLAAVAAQRTAEALGAPAKITQFIPDSTEQLRQAGIDDIDIQDAVAYYKTPRAAHPNSPNKLLFTSLDKVIAFDAFHLAAELLTQPLLVVIGDQVGAFASHRHGYMLFDRAASTDKELFIVKGAKHYDFYDQPSAVKPTVTKLTEFFGKYL